jgi:hypothetical protein
MFAQPHTGTAAVRVDEFNAGSLMKFAGKARSGTTDLNACLVCLLTPAVFLVAAYAGGTPGSPPKRYPASPRKINIALLTRAMSAASR